MLDEAVASVEDARGFVRTERRAFSVAEYNRCLVLNKASKGTIFNHKTLPLFISVPYT